MQGTKELDIDLQNISQYQFISRVVKTNCRPVHNNVPSTCSELTITILLLQLSLTETLISVVA